MNISINLKVGITPSTGEKLKGNFQSWYCQLYKHQTSNMSPPWCLTEVWLSGGHLEFHGQSDNRRLSVIPGHLQNCSLYQLQTWYMSPPRWMTEAHWFPGSHLGVLGQWDQNGYWQFLGHVLQNYSEPQLQTDAYWMSGNHLNFNVTEVGMVSRHFQTWIFQTFSPGLFCLSTSILVCYLRGGG